MSPKGRPEGESAPKRVSAEDSPASKPSDTPPVVVRPGDLPVFCPNPAMPLWSSHPRVFLDVEKGGTVRCPYCSTEYRLEGGARAGHA